MFDAYIGNVNLGVAMLTLSILVVLPLQIVLCCKIRLLAVRLLPVLLSAIGAAACAVLAYGAQDWESVFYALLACYCAMLLASAALGWLLWGLARVWKRRRDQLTGK